MKYEFIQEGVYEKQKAKKNIPISFKEEAVKLITNEGYSFAEAGRNLGVNPNLISRWKRELDKDGSKMAPEQLVTMRALSFHP